MNKICDSFVQTGTTAKIRKTHAKDSLQVTVDTRSHNLESDPTPVGTRSATHWRTPRIRLLRTLPSSRVCASAACLAQLIEHL